MDYFNEKEREKQLRFSRSRDVFFSPLTRLLLRFNISPNAVSLIGVLFLILSVCTTNFYVIGSSLALYVLMDGIDGPLARARINNNPNGDLIDIFCDQLGVVILAAGSTYYFGVPGFIAVLYSTFYIASISLKILINQRGLISVNIIRLKYPFFVLYAITSIQDQFFLTEFMFLNSLYYIWFTTIVVFSGNSGKDH